MTLTLLALSIAFDSTSLAAIGGILAGSTFLMLVLVALIAQLAGFHSVLVYKGLTTYDFIVQEQKRQRELEALRVSSKRAKERAAGGGAGSASPNAKRLAAAAADRYREEHSGHSRQEDESEQAREY
eukprot:gene28003-34794_t